MNIFKNVHKTLFAVALATFTLGFTACSNDDNDTPGDKNLAIETEMGLFGTYAGDFELVNPSAEDKTRTDGDVSVPESDKVRLVVSPSHAMEMDVYPINELISELYEDAEEAQKVIDELENISPKMTFVTKEISTKKGTISFDIDAENVKVTLENGDVIEFDFDDNDQLGMFNNTEIHSINFTMVAKAELYSKANPETKDVEPTKVATNVHNFNLVKLTK